jgi:hypothetical protein
VFILSTAMIYQCTVIFKGAGAERPNITTFSDVFQECNANLQAWIGQAEIYISKRMPAYTDRGLSGP